jgi:hypothetical protein
MVQIGLIESIIALIGTAIGGGGIVKLIDYFFLKPREKLDTYPALIAQIKVSLIEPLQGELTIVHEEVKVLRAKVNIYENHLMRTPTGEKLVERTRKQFTI